MASIAYQAAKLVTSHFLARYDLKCSCSFVKETNSIKFNRLKKETCICNMCCYMPLKLYEFT